MRLTEWGWYYELDHQDKHTRRDLYDNSATRFKIGTIHADSLLYFHLSDFLLMERAYCLGNKLFNLYFIVLLFQFALFWCFVLFQIFVSLMVLKLFMFPLIKMFSFILPCFLWRYNSNHTILRLSSLSLFVLFFNLYLSNINHTAVAFLMVSVIRLVVALSM